jgi:hypothetical protein
VNRDNGTDLANGGWLLVGIMAAPVFWILSVGHASFTYRRELVERHADLIATKMAEKMKQP